MKYEEKRRRHENDDDDEDDDEENELTKAQFILKAKDSSSQSDSSATTDGAKVKVETITLSSLDSELFDEVNDLIESSGIRRLRDEEGELDFSNVEIPILFIDEDDVETNHRMTPAELKKFVKEKLKAGNIEYMIDLDEDED